jgi:hypothetical protein
MAHCSYKWALTLHQDFSTRATGGDLLAKENLQTVSQLLEENDFTGCLTMDENRTLKEELTPFPLLQYKLQLLVSSLRY